MSQMPSVTISAATSQGSASASTSAAVSEKTASSPATASSAPATENAPTPRLRSCVTCRSRKVRCDKLSPCSNCRRANIACVVPSTDRPPRWARRLGYISNNAASNAQAEQASTDLRVGQVMERLRTLESLVKELSGQLEQAHAAANSVAGGSSGVSPPSSSTQDREAEHQRSASPTTSAGNVQKQFGRLVLQDASRSRYVGTGFWSRVNDELEGLKMDTCGLAGDDFDTSEDEVRAGKTTSTQELERTPSERHALLFRHNLSPSAPGPREFHPLPSQIPFLLDVFSENVNFALQIVHMPTVTRMVRDLRGDMTSLTPANEALMLSIYYAAITSMEEDDIMTNFGFTKTDLNLKYRLGLEHALAKADFLNVPDVVLVQAFTIFLFLLRRHDSPRFVWMMTGLLIRMAQALGLHRDGANFEHLRPYEIEMRRRVWWAVCILDVRASEDQGTDLTITSGSFDTKLPLNINDTDIQPDSKQMPTERQGLTDMSFALIWFDVTRQMMALIIKDGAPDLERQSRLLNEMYQKVERNHFKYSTESGNMAYWVAVTLARLVMAKMTLIIYLPVLFFSPSEHFSDEIRAKLFASAIEVAEYNHALNAEQRCRQWRWGYQTCTHWHAIVYLLIEISRRPWSPVVERAWVALHSSWLIPAQSYMDKNMRIWVPLRKLMSKARKHRDAELERLKSDTRAAERLEMDDNSIPVPRSSGPFPAGTNAVDLFRERWRQLVAMPEGRRHGPRTSASLGAGPSNSSVHTVSTSQPNIGSMPVYSASDVSSGMSIEPAYLGASGPQTGQNPSSTDTANVESVLTTNHPSELALGQTSGASYDPFSAVPPDCSYDQVMGAGFVPWLWADADPSVDVFATVDVDAIDVDMDLDGEVNWYNWVESAKSGEWEADPNGNRRA
ncbi:fungal-specific transcription factor domain-containing protein [Lipomyces tetrasporus]|uniref:Fungal-specific transcription factor domain-containing protein n=1 Tax=Lipomyces tetrasporus TaxID=54092 RepID=A0AAD7QXU2_9ASCO|nr:fungal-specific transcription factor domain-containing protein [Lipomyces tetrasporus]KAJ8103394.1 fungal-specific transcription factor domain-containing protein [Lipomyces tetrasporus]